MTIGERIKSIRESLGITQVGLADMIGEKKQTLYKYENNIITNIPIEKIELIAKAMHTTPSIIMGWKDEPDLPKNIIPMPEMKKIPLVGAIACGAPILADEHIEDYIDIPAHIRADFALTCKGDSMINARIYDGDIVYVRQQETVENGEIAAVLIDDEATLKRVRLLEDRIVLEPANPLYDPLVYRGEEMAEVHILGKAVAFTSTIR